MKLVNSRRTLAVAIPLLLAGGLISACGAADEGNEAASLDTYAKFADMAGDERHDALVEAAKKEGKLSIYSTNSALESTIGPAFEKEYGIDLTIYRATTEELRTRILQEAAAGRIQNDVVETKDSEMALLSQEADLIQPYESDISEGIDDLAKTEYMTAAYYIATLPIHNSDEVDSADLPTDISGYADPEWKDKLAIDQGDFNWYQDLYRHYTEDEGMSDDDFVEMMKAVAANARAVDGHVANTELLSAGDFAVFLSDFLHYVPKDGSGTLSFEPVMEPVTLQLLGAQPMKKAENPAAALLFCDFYLTEGQKFLDDAGFIPTNPDQIEGYQPRLPEGTTFVTDDWETLVEDGNAWQTAFDNLLKGKDPVLPE